MHRCLPAIAAIYLMTVMAHAQDKAESKGNANTKIATENPVGYFLGLSMGQQLAGQGLSAEDFDPAALAAGVSDALAGGDLALSDKEIAAAQSDLQALLNQRFAKYKADLEARAKKNKENGAKWLAENKKKDGVKELAGGMQYKVLSSGKGGSPSQSDKVKVHYTGKLTNGTVFDSSVKRGEPASFMVGGVIKGWQMALTKMKVGDKWMLYIPPALAYGERGSPGAIGPNEVLVFEVELLEIL